MPMADRTNGTSGTVQQLFGGSDLGVFIASLAVGAFIGIYFACFAKKGKNEEADYLFGGRDMGVFPIALSLVASYVSGITLLGMPAEVYVYGYQIVYYNVVFWGVSYVYIKQILPVFHDLQGLSLNEYFLKRFDKKVRILVSSLYVINAITYLPITGYLPALAYEQVSGYNRHYVTPFVCLVCIFYTSMVVVHVYTKRTVAFFDLKGGIKAVVWTDVIQMFSLLISVLLVAVKGTYDVGGITDVWERNVETGRIEAPHVDIDPTVRHTIFGILINGFLHTLKYGCLNQAMVQRHQSLPTLNQAKRAMWIYTACLTMTNFLAGYCGLVIAAYYFRCDPISMKLAQAKDQIMPLFVMQTLGHIPGLVGLFISGIFSAALSSMSTVLNTVSGVFVEDWIRGCTPWNPTEHQATWIMRIFVVIMGLITIAFIFMVEKLGMVVQMATSINALTGGAVLTVFLLGLFVPWVTSTGVLVGAAAAIVTIAPLLLGSQFSISQGLLQFPAKPVSLEGCTDIYNVSAEFMKSVHPPPETLMPAGPTRGDVWYILRISYLWYTPISTFFGFFAGLLVTTLISRSDLRRLDRRLIAPMSRRWLPKDNFDAPERGHHTVIAKFE